MNKFIEDLEKEIKNHNINKNKAFKALPLAEGLLARLKNGEIIIKSKVSQELNHSGLTGGAKSRLSKSLKKAKIKYKKVA